MPCEGGKAWKQSTGDIPKIWTRTTKSSRVPASQEWPASQLQSQILHLLLHWDKKVLGLDTRLLTREQACGRLVVASSSGVVVTLSRVRGEYILVCGLDIFNLRIGTSSEPSVSPISPTKAGLAGKKAGVKMKTLPFPGCLIGRDTFPPVRGT